MKKAILLVFLFAGLISTRLSGQNAAIIHISELEKILNSTSDTLYVVNFWATWCKPCVAELPYFSAAHDHFAGKPVKVLLVSLDFKSDYETRLIPFLKKKNPTAQVVMLDEPNYNAWIDKVSPEWSGAIPATIFLKGSSGIRDFHEGEFSQETLYQLIEKYLSEQP